jgi:conjugative transfer region protein TrbK
MARCQALGLAAENDAACQAVWAENRRRFFNESPAPEAR